MCRLVIRSVSKGCMMRQVSCWCSVGLVRDSRCSMMVSNGGSVVNGNWRNVSNVCNVVNWFLVNNRVEAVVWVSGILDGTPGAIRVDQRVATVYDVTVASLVLALYVASVRVVNYIIKRNIIRLLYELK